MLETKSYIILKTFPGNQTGNGPAETFEEGTVRDLTDRLAEVVVPAGFARLNEEKASEPADENKAVGAAPENKSKKKAKAA